MSMNQSLGKELIGAGKALMANQMSPIALAEIRDQITAHLRTMTPGQTKAVMGDYDQFRQAFQKLDHSLIYVRICNMRRELGWPPERFNAILRKLRADATIQLHAGDASTMTEEDISLSYTDDNGFFYITMTWEEK